MSGGTLDVYGNWEEQGTGTTTATGGTITFRSNLDQTIQMTANSDLNNVQFGSGTTQTISVNSDLELQSMAIPTLSMSLETGVMEAMVLFLERVQSFLMAQGRQWIRL